MKIFFVLLFSSIFFFNNSIARATEYQITTSTSDSFVKSFMLDNQQSVVIEEGRIEPRSIGSISIKLYRNLDVGDFTDGIVIPRDGTILSVKILKPTKAEMVGGILSKLQITTVTAGSGNYQNIQMVCVSDNKVDMCQ